MKAYIIIILLIYSTAFCANGQTTPETDTTHPRWHCDPVNDSARTPFIILDKCAVTSRLDMSSIISLLNSSNIDGFDIFKGNDPRAKAYGEKGKNGIILIKLKDSVKLVPLTSLLFSKKYRIAPDDRKLKICINENLLVHPDQTLADENVKLNIEIVTGKYWDHTRETPVAERFINIITRKPDRNVFYIR